MRTLFSGLVEQAFRKPGRRPEMSPAAFVGLIPARSAAQTGMLLMATVFRVVR
jgi:hypothetical protein